MVNIGNKERERKPDRVYVSKFQPVKLPVSARTLEKRLSSHYC